MEDETDDLQGNPKEELTLYDKLDDAVRTLLAPYEPADSEGDCDKRFSTNDIIAAIEMHYGIPQGSTDFVNLIAGPKIVEILTALGFKYVNTGGLQLEWVFKLKQ